MSRVTVSPSVEEEKKTIRQKKDHWANDQGTAFRNPWKSFAKKPGGWDMIPLVYKMSTKSDPDIANAKAVIPQVKASFAHASDSSRKLKATWLGHACYLLEFPVEKEGRKGLTVLLDPVFSQRCSPFTWMGPARFTPPPCTVEDLPEVDIIVISHSHYDHEDLPTLTKLYKKQSDYPPVMLIPLNTAHTLAGKSIPPELISELDWWDSRDVVVEGKGRVKLTCTPSQHTSGRSALDQDTHLWASWAVQAFSETGEKGASVWFGGDTGYCSVPDQSHTINPTLPTCPAFREIGSKLGPFTLGLIPIGAYDPRPMFSPVHNAPIDAVRMFTDTRCKEAIGIHWGTWSLTTEPITEPPRRLADARVEVGLEEKQFYTVAIGETRSFDP